MIDFEQFARDIAPIPEQVRAAFRADLRKIFPANTRPKRQKDQAT